MPKRSGRSQPGIRFHALGAAAILTAVLATPIALSASPPPRDIARCAPASRILPGTRSGVARAALKSVSSGFTLRLAETARSRDLNYQFLAAECSKAMVRRTWYTDLHPAGQQCGACDSHEYWVLLRRGGWATLGHFGG
jgi:hypothetical protein